MRYKVYDRNKPHRFTIVDAIDIRDENIKHLAIQQSIKFGENDFNNLKVKRLKQGEI